MYDIFLSYARDDDEPFVKMLYTRLKSAGIATFFDRVSMPSRALTFLQEIRAAIDDSKRVLVVIGPHALASDYVRAEWQHALVTGKVVTALIREGKRSQLPAELRGPHCPDFRPQRDEEEAWNELQRILSEPILPLGILRGDPPNLPPHFQPRPSHLSTMADLVLSDAKAPVTMEETEHVLVVHGMGGIGKSVLASAFTRATFTRRSFGDGVFWLSVGKKAHASDLFRRLGILLGDGPQHYSDLEMAQSRMRERLEKIRALIVFDNVWLLNQIAPLLETLGPNCRGLLTTRDAGLATSTGANLLQLDLLSPDESLRLLADWSNQAVKDLPQEAVQVAEECGHLPLGLALNGAMAASGISWQDLLVKLHDAKLDFAEHWIAGYPHPNMLRSIKVSIDALAESDEPPPKDGTISPTVQRYAELAAFLSEEGIPEPAVATLWKQRDGFDEADTRKLLTILECKALLRLEGELPDRRIILHDLYRDYLKASFEHEKAVNQILLQAYHQVCDGDWPRLPNDGYIHHHLVKHLLVAEDYAEIHRLLALETEQGRNAWYEVNDTIGNFDGYIQDIETAAGLSEDGSLQRTLHYALINASMRSLVSNLPSPLRVELLRQGEWTSIRALSDVLELSEGRVDDMADLLPYLDAQTRCIALDELFVNPDSSALLQLLPELSGSDRRAAIDLLLSLSETMSCNDCAWLLIRLAEHLTGEERSQILDEAFKAAMQTPDHFDQSKRLAQLAAAREEGEMRTALTELAINAFKTGIANPKVRDPNDQSFALKHVDTLRILAPVLTSALNLELAEQALGFESEAFAQMQVFGEILPYVDEKRRDEIARRALEIEAQCTSNSFAYRAKYAQHLTDPPYDKIIEAITDKESSHAAYVINILPAEVFEAQARQALNKIKEPGDRIKAWIQALPRLGEKEREQKVRSLIEEIPDLPYPTWRKNAVQNIAPYLPTDLLQTARTLLSGIDDADHIAIGLAALAGYLGDAHLGDVLEAVLKIGDERYRLATLVELAFVLPIEKREIALQAAVDMLSSIPLSSGHVKALTDLSDWIAAEYQGRFLNAALQSIFAFPGSVSFVLEEFLYLARRLPPDIRRAKCHALLDRARAETEQKNETSALADAISKLKYYIDPELVGELLQEIRNLENPAGKFAGLAVLAAMVTNEEHSAVVDEVLAIEATLQPGEALSRHLISLADNLEGDARQAILNKALEAARGIESSWRAYSLIDVALALDPDEQIEVLHEAMETANPLNLLHISQHLPDSNERIDVLRQAMADMSGFSDIQVGFYSGGACEPGLGEQLAVEISKAPEQVLHEVWNETIHKLSTRTRPELVGDFAALRAMIYAIGGEQAISALANSILKVRCWWPSS